MLRRLSITLASAFLLPLASPAQASSGVCEPLTGTNLDGCLAMVAEAATDCVGIRRSVHRLTCWDRLHSLANCPPSDTAEGLARCGVDPRRRSVADVASSGDLANVELTSNASEGDRWSVTEDVSAFSETTDVFLSIASVGPVSCGPRSRATLILRCLQDRTALVMVHDCATPQVVGDGWAVDLRVDDAPQERVRMTPTQRGDGFGHFDYQPARTLMDRLATANTLHMRFADIEGFNTEVSFPVTGLSDHLPTLATACGWSEVPPWERDAPSP